MLITFTCTGTPMDYSQLQINWVGKTSHLMKPILFGSILIRPQANELLLG